MFFDDFLDDGEPQSGAGLFVRRHERLKQLGFNAFGNTGAAIRDSHHQLTVLQCRRQSQFPAGAQHRLDGVPRQIVNGPRHPRLVDVHYHLSIDVDRQANRMRIRRTNLDLVPQLFLDLVKKRSHVYTPHKHVSFPARELQHLALHVGEHLKLFEYFCGVLLPRFPVVGLLHHLHVTADYGHGGLKIVNYLRQKTPDRRQSCAPLASFAGSEKSHGRGHVCADQTQQGDIFRTEASTSPLAEQRHGANRSGFALQRYCDHTSNRERKFPLRFIAIRLVVGTGSDLHNLILRHR